MSGKDIFEGQWRVRLLQVSHHLHKLGLYIFTNNMLNFLLHGISSVKFIILCLSSTPCPGVDILGQILKIKKNGI